MTWPIVADISNYDYDEDLDEPTWVQKFKDAGIDGVIVGSQWPLKARAQLEALRYQGLRIVGTYAEPNANSAIKLAQEFDGKHVGLACERGSILTQAELQADIDLVRGAGLTPWIYGNASDLIAIAGLDLLYSADVWLANYGWNNPSVPRDPITEYDFGRGPRALIAHQFSSTIVVAGRNRDHSYLYLEEEEDMASTIEIEDLILSVWGADGEQSLDRATRLTNARYRLANAIADKAAAESIMPLAGQAAAATYVALQSTGAISDAMTPDEVKAIVDAELAKARIVVGT